MQFSAADQSQISASYEYRALLEKATVRLGGTLLPETFSTIEQAGLPTNNNRRIYHTFCHFREISHSPYTRLLEDLPTLAEEFNKLGMAQLFDIVAAVMMRAGAHHDIVYHVDKEYIPADILRSEQYRILPPRSVDAPNSDYIVTAAEPEGEAGILLDMARTLFDVMPRDFLTQFNGKNEFLSAIYAGLQGLKEHIPLKYLLAEMMMIEATRPFEAPDRLMRLRARFEAANRLLSSGSQLDAQELDAFLLGATHLANCDVIDFTRNFNCFLKGSVDLLHEAGRPIISVEDYFIQATNREAFFMNLLEKLQHGDAAIFHGIRFNQGGEVYFPPRGALDICEKNARENIRKDILMSRALKISAALATVVEASYGSGDMEGIPNMLVGHQKAVTAGYPAMRDPSMTETALAMRDCASRVPLLALASFLLGHLSETNLLRLAEKTSHQFQAYQEHFIGSFATRKASQEMLEWLQEYPELATLESMIMQALGYEQPQRQHQP